MREILRKPVEVLRQVGSGIFVPRVSVLGRLFASITLVAACTPSSVSAPSESQKTKIDPVVIVVSDVPRQSSGDTFDLTTEQILAARKYKKDVLEEAKEFIGKTYLEDGIIITIPYPPDEEDVFWRRKVLEMEDSFTQEIRVGKNGRQRFNIQNKYDGGQLVETVIYPGEQPIHAINLGLVPQNVLTPEEMRGENIPVNKLKAVAVTLFDLPDNLSWEDGNVCYTLEGSQRHTARAIFAKGKTHSGWNLNFVINEPADALLRVADPSLDKTEFAFRFRC